MSVLKTPAARKKTTSTGRGTKATAQRQAAPACQFHQSHPAHILREARTPTRGELARACHSPRFLPAPIPPAAITLTRRESTRRESTLRESTRREFTRRESARACHTLQSPPARILRPALGFIHPAASSRGALSALPHAPFRAPPISSGPRGYHRPLFRSRRRRTLTRPA